ncbi:MAG: hypothetical protein ACRELC_09365 [Gemmatimonadota bacterium]
MQERERWAATVDAYAATRARSLLWWAAHDRRNRAWIEAVAPRLDEVEESVIPRLVAAYGGAWPDERIPVDVVAYANAVGAYSTGGRLTISSVDRGNAMPQAVELVFHEASHIDPLERPLRVGLEAAYSAAGGEPPDRLWHDVIFYTSGELTRIVLAGVGAPRRPGGCRARAPRRWCVVPGAAVERSAASLRPARVVAPIACVIYYLPS